MRTLICGFDAFDPAIFERLANAGRMPHLTALVSAGGYSRLAVANPPQSEVSWTSIATALNPGVHGLFDFVHRNPASYALSVSLLPTRKGFAGWRFVPPTTARTLFDTAADRGYPSTMLWWPATFPARPASPVRTIPGLGTPDVHGRLGVGTWFVADEIGDDPSRKTAVARLASAGAGRYRGRLSGPVRQTMRGQRPSALDVMLETTGEAGARLTVGDQRLALALGKWSAIFELKFRLGRFITVSALTRALLTQTDPARFYLLPLQLHPLHAPWPYGSPRSFQRRVWQAAGPFLTLGWPQDTTALEDGCIGDHAFLDLCRSIDQGRERVLDVLLDSFDEGVLGIVFDSLDRVQHMFGRDRPDVVEDWYVRLDGIIGRLQARFAANGGTRVRLLVVSDHGFAPFEYKVSPNRWLLEHGYLALKADATGVEGSFHAIDWSRTRAYAIGLNSLYLNQAGRESQGVVTANERVALLDRLRTDLAAWQGPDGRPVLHAVRQRDEAFEGALAPHAPDLLLGYAPGYRASQETGLGGWRAASVEPNRDHWGADHCMDAEAVSGVVFANVPLRASALSYRDVPALAIDAAPDSRGASPPVLGDDEDEALLKERLKGLGYL